VARIKSAAIRDLNGKSKSAPMTSKNAIIK
jgi:hypothetical protein